MEYHNQAPLVPRKPTEYARSHGTATTMNELLSSLSLDEGNPQQHHRGDRRSYAYDDARLAESRQPVNRASQDTMRQYNTSYNASDHGSGVARRADSATSPAQAYADGDIRQTMSRQRGLMDNVNGKSPEGATPLLTSTPTTHLTKWPARKPINANLPRSYYSPDDLDQLLVERPRPADSLPLRAPDSNAAATTYQRSTVEGFQSPKGGYEGHTARNSYSPYSPYAGQVPQAENYKPDLAQNPATPSFQSPRSMYPASPVHQQSTYPRALDDEGGQDRGMTQGFTVTDDGRRRSASVLPRQDLHYALMPAQVRLPSPPIRQDSISPDFTGPVSPGALQSHPSLAPSNRSHMMQQYEGAFSPPVRRESLPLRTMSSLSNNSQRSPERQQRPPISELESQYGGRIPSPDRSLQFPDHDYEPERAGAESVPPHIQMRRGRPKGEHVQESDLPAMPLLFHSQRDHEQTLVSSPTNEHYYSAPAFRAPTRTGTALSTASSTSASPTRASNVAMSTRPAKQASFGREPDLLQSVRVLPVKPIRCPPLCLEERFHPSSYAKTNKFKIKVHPGQAPFVAGGEIFGHVDIISDEGFRAQLGSTQVLVGEIGVEVIGYEEIQHNESGHNPRSLTFLFSRKVFQPIADTHPIRSQEEHVLTSAVLSNPPPDKDGYRAPSKGTTSFPFAFPLPVDCPSSADIHVARIKYVVTGYATVKLQGSEETIATSHSVRVVEAWDVDNPVYLEAIEGTQGRDIANYQEIAAVAKIGKSLYLEGQTIQGSIKVVNHSSKKIREVKFFLVNKITFFGDKRSPVRDLNPQEDFSLEETVVGHTEPHVIFRGGQEEWIFSLQIPADRCISIRNSALFEVTPFILIKISTGPLQKSTRVYMPPVSIANQHSMLDGREKKAPVSDPMKWSNLPQLYRSQKVIEGQVQTAEKGTLELTELVTYIGAHQRVMLLSAQQ